MSEDTKRDIASEETLQLDPLSFGHYRVVGKIGKGGMGAVYKVADEAGNVFALKSLNPETARNVEFVHRFLREARLALTLRHPHIVRTVDSGHAADGSLYIVSEYCSRGSLLRHLEANGPLPAELAVHWMVAVASALEYVWDEHAMIHRDIKPANLLLDADGHIKVADLGLAKRTTADATQLTADGVALGSVKYIAPEQATGLEKLDCRTDLYALGATFYHLLRGEPMFDGDTPAKLIVRHVKEEPAPLCEFRADVPDSVCGVIHRLVQKRREDRPQTPAELRDELTRVAGDLGMDLDAFVLSPGASEYQRTFELNTPPLDGGATIDVDEATTVLPGEGRVLSLFRDGPDAGPWPGDKAWLTIESASANKKWDIALYLNDVVGFGRSRAGDVDMPVRIYPIEVGKKASMRISSRHGQFAATDDGWTVTDLDSRNGLSVNDEEVEAGELVRLPGRADVRISAAIALSTFAMGRARARFITVDGEVVQPATNPALVVTRPDNRPELVYVVLREHLHVGGRNPANALAPEGLCDDHCGTLWRLGGKLYWQPAASAQLTCCAPGATWDAKGVTFRIEPFSFDRFR